jgi:CHAT domain-containing protein
VPHVSRNQRWRVLAPWIGGAVIGVAAAAVWLQRPQADRFSIASLAAASRSDVRAVEARLTGGFTWAPFRSETRSASASLALAAAIGLATPPGDGESATARHTAGVAHLLAGRHREALSALSVAETSRDARTWSDLAAARYAASTRFDAPELLGDALAATDAALSLDPDLAEALFNRALILERLGLRDDARAAWNRYVLHDSDARWLAEGREHLAAVALFTPFKETLSRDYERLVRDPARARALAGQNPEGARIQGLAEVLGRWAEAERTNDPRAPQHLGLARELGSEIARLNGDRMLADAVAAIERADKPSRSAFASAHRDYTAGIKSFWNGQAAAAEPLLHRAVATLDRLDSPALPMARFYVASAVFDQGRRAEACAALDLMLLALQAHYPAVRGHVLSQLGACRFAAAQWGESMRILEESAAIFDRLGELGNASAVRRLIAMIYDRTGARDKAWEMRMIALRGIGRESNLRLEKAVSSIAHEAMLRGNWSTAAAFLNVEIDIARRIDDRVHLAETLAIRAAVRHQLNDADGARADLASAAEVTARLEDPGYRAYMEHDQLIVKAMLMSSPAEADALLTRAIAFQSASGDRMNLPGLYLQRARARRRSDPAGAAADLDRGIAELETSRQSLPQGEARWGAFHAADELFAEAIELRLDEGNVEGAFVIAERARARSLLDGYGRPPALDYRSLPGATVVVEYAALSDRLVIFTADRNGVQAATSSGGSLAAEVETLLKALQTDDASLKRAAAAVHRRLIEPVAGRIVGAATIVFVPDGATSTIPFAALVDARGQFLLESHTVVVAPSAALFAAAGQRRRTATPPRSALVIADRSLPAAASEAAQINRLYGHSFEWKNGDDLHRQTAEADVLHFAGHGIGDDGGLEPASIVLQEEGAERRLAAADLAKLPLRRTAIVVLAGCSTARGERRGPEGVISVAHGFLSAGAPSVVATLWKIDDSAAAKVFPDLHALLARGVAPAEALRTVQLECIRRGDVPASLWAALQLIGS